MDEIATEDIWLDTATLTLTKSAPRNGRVVCVAGVPVSQTAKQMLDAYSFAEKPKPRRSRKPKTETATAPSAEVETATAPDSSLIED